MPGKITLFGLMMILLFFSSAGPGPAGTRSPMYADKTFPGLPFSLIPLADEVELQYRGEEIQRLYTAITFKYTEPERYSPSIFLIAVVQSVFSRKLLSGEGLSGIEERMKELSYYDNFRMKFDIKMKSLNSFEDLINVGEVFYRIKFSVHHRF